MTLLSCVGCNKEASWRGCNARRCGKVSRWWWLSGDERTLRRLGQS